MKNADKPAMPIEFNGFGQFSPEAHTGMTKREIIAMNAMQGILANSASEDIGYNEWAEGVAKHSIAAADALLKELEK